MKIDNQTLASDSAAAAASGKDIRCLFTLIIQNKKFKKEDIQGFTIS